ncbi:unnamed protein product [Musa acuminata subsp. malaccensis]|uniref:(wild Malaysian banana) hypothetical protein n=1 Tax=Musa acuminata subsp. malaccensis TaxID=214687 RepID=A0A8D7FQX3_MUSAM|nr:unnamed protein product [Musa acuminata subsp. malaccensis]
MYFSVHTLKNLMSLDDSFMLEAHQLSESDIKFAATVFRPFSLLTPFRSKNSEKKLAA